MFHIIIFNSLGCSTFCFSYRWNLRLRIKTCDQTKPQMRVRVRARARARACWKITVERSFGDLTICDLLTFHSLDSFHRVLQCWYTKEKVKYLHCVQCSTVQCSAVQYSIFSILARSIATFNRVSAAKAHNVFDFILSLTRSFYLHHNSAHCDEKTSQSASGKVQKSFTYQTKLRQAQACTDVHTSYTHIVYSLSIYASKLLVSLALFSTTSTKW